MLAAAAELRSNGEAAGRVGFKLLLTDRLQMLAVNSLQQPDTGSLCTETLKFRRPAGSSVCPAHYTTGVSPEAHTTHTGVRALLHAASHNLHHGQLSGIIMVLKWFLNDLFFVHCY